MLRTRAPLYSGLLLFALDLHVLGTPPAFVLSQDQTLQLRDFDPCPPLPFARRLAWCTANVFANSKNAGPHSFVCLLFSFQRPSVIPQSRAAALETSPERPRKSRRQPFCVKEGRLLHRRSRASRGDSRTSSRTVSRREEATSTPTRPVRQDFPATASATVRSKGALLLPPPCCPSSQAPGASASFGRCSAPPACSRQRGFLD